MWPTACFCMEPGHFDSWPVSYSTVIWQGGWFAALRLRKQRGLWGTLYFREPGFLACTWQRESYITRTLVADPLMGFPGQKPRMCVPAFLLLQKEYTVWLPVWGREHKNDRTRPVCGIFPHDLLALLCGCYTLAMSTTLTLNPIHESFQSISKPGGLGTPITPESNKECLHFLNGF